MNTPPISYADQLAAILSRIPSANRQRDLLETFDERAGICEYDGGLTRHEAERMAFLQVHRMLRADEK